MPEFPEVYTTVKGLNKNIVGLKIVDIWQGAFSSHPLFTNTIKNKKYFTAFKKKVIGSKVKNVSQKAKYILIELDNSFTIVIHMKMTGHLLFGKWKKEKENWKPLDTKSALNDPFNRHIRTMFTFSNDKQLAFCDSRKFGSVELFENKNLDNRFIKLGPTPFEIDIKKFKELLLKSNREIKTVLMDQTLVSGIGNIYSDEALFRTHVLPIRKINSLTENEWKLLFKSIKEVLNGGIKFGGDSMSDYRNVYGERGNFQNKHLVYQRKGGECKTKGCKGVIKKKKIGGRSACYCDICQK